MSYPNGCYRKVANLRIRPVPEMELCLIFTPDNPNLYSLSATAWLILELAPGRRPDALEDAYYDIVEPLVSRGAAREQVARTVQTLFSNGILEWDGAAPVPAAMPMAGTGP